MTAISMKVPKHNIDDDNVEEEDKYLIGHEKSSDILTSETNLCWLFSENETRPEVAITKTTSTSKIIFDSTVSQIQKDISLKNNANSTMKLQNKPNSYMVNVIRSNASIPKRTMDIQTDKVPLATMTDESKANIATEKRRICTSMSDPKLGSVKVRRHSSSTLETRYDAKLELANEIKLRYPTTKYPANDYIEIVPMSSQTDSRIDPSNFGKVRYPTAKYVSTTEMENVKLGSQSDWKADLAGLRILSTFNFKNVKNDIEMLRMETGLVTRHDPTNLENHNISQEIYAVNNESKTESFQLNSEAEFDITNDSTNEGNIIAFSTKDKEFEDHETGPSQGLHAEPYIGSTKVGKDSKTLSKYAANMEDLAAPSIESQTVSKTDSTELDRHITSTTKFPNEASNEKWTVFSMEPSTQSQIQTNQTKFKKPITVPLQFCEGFEQIIISPSTESHIKSECDPAKVTKCNVFPSKCVKNTVKASTLSHSKSKVDSTMRKIGGSSPSKHTASIELVQVVPAPSTKSQTDLNEIRRLNTPISKNALSKQKVTVLSTLSHGKPYTDSVKVSRRSFIPTRNAASPKKVTATRAEQQLKANADSAKVKRSSNTLSKYAANHEHVTILSTESQTEPKTNSTEISRHSTSATKHASSTEKVVAIISTDSHIQPNTSTVNAKFPDASPLKISDSIEQVVILSTGSRTKAKTDSSKVRRRRTFPNKYDAGTYEVRMPLIESHTKPKSVHLRRGCISLPKYEVSPKHMTVTSTESQENANIESENFCTQDITPYKYEASTKPVTDPSTFLYKYVVNSEQVTVASKLSPTFPKSDLTKEGKYSTAPPKYVSNTESESFSTGAQTEPDGYSAKVKKIKMTENINMEIVSIASQTEPNMGYAIGRFPKYVTKTDQETVTMWSQTEPVNVRSRSTSPCKPVEGFEKVIVSAIELQTKEDTDLVNENISSTSEANLETVSNSIASQTEQKNDLATKIGTSNAKYVAKIEKEAVSVDAQKGSKSYYSHGRVCRNLDSKFSGNHWKSSERWMSPNLPQNEVVELRHHSKDCRRTTMNPTTKVFQALVPQSSREEKWKRHNNCETSISNAKKLKEPNSEQTTSKETVLPNGTIFKQSFKIDNKLLGILGAGKDVDPMCIVSKIPTKEQKENFVLGIVDHSNVYGRINEEHFTILENGFNDLLAKSILEAPDSHPEIQIAKCEFVQGIYKITLGSTNCIDRLRELVEGMPEFWPGAQLHLVRDFVLPVLTKAAFYVRSGGTRRSSKEILKIIHGQNRGLIVDLWEIYHRVETEEGTFLVVGMDASSVAYLQSCQGQIFFLASKISVKMEDKGLRENVCKCFKESVGTYNRNPEIDVVQAKECQQNTQTNLLTEMTDINQTSELEASEKYWDYYFLNKSANFFFKNDEN